MSPLISVGSGDSWPDLSRVRQHFLPQRTDRVAAHRHFAGRIGHHGLLLGGGRAT